MSGPWHAAGICREDVLYPTNRGRAGIIPLRPRSEPFALNPKYGNFGTTLFFSNSRQIKPGFSSLMSRQEDITRYYEHLAPEYDDNRFGNSYGQFIDRQERSYLNRMLAGYKLPAVLDMGCGTGRFLEFAGYGIDASQAMIDRARIKFPDRILYLDDIRHTHFEDNSFDAIICFHVIMHLDKQDTADFLKESFRLLRPGGRLIFDFPSQHRRKRLGFHTTGWHGANGLRIIDPRNMVAGFRPHSSQGVMFLPIHRFPGKIRKWVSGIDGLLCRSFLKKYASYIMVTMVKHCPARQ